MGVRGAYTHRLLTHFLPAKVWTCVFLSPSYTCGYFCTCLLLCPCLHKKPSPLSLPFPLLQFTTRIAHATAGSDLVYKTLYSTHIYTNAHTDCVQLKPRASVCAYYDFLYQVKGSENSIFSAQRHMHTVTSAELSRLSSVALTAKHFYQLRHHFTIVSCKLH